MTNHYTDCELKAGLPMCRCALRGSLSVPASGSVFEVVDTTAEEQYYTLGIWPTFEAAMDALAQCGDDPPGEDFDEDCKVFEVRERKLGAIDWSGTGRVAARVQWVKSYEDDTYGEWKRVNTPNSCIQQT